MKMHIITVGEPKLSYAKEGWQEYFGRLRHYHELRVSHLANKYAGNAAKILDTAGAAYKIALVISGRQFSSTDLADLLKMRALEGREVAFIIGGPDGLPAEVIARADLQWSFAKLTFPHDLAMVMLLETLYRASTINAGLPYHK